MSKSPADRSRKRRVFEIVCEDIRDGVGCGFLKPGDKLPPERQFAERLGVSRTAVREALRALEASGVLDFRKGAHGGAFIRAASASGIRSSMSDMLSIGNISLEDLSEARSSLLALAVEFACARATDRDFALLEENIERSAALEDGHDVPAMIDTISEFYILIGNASHNGVLRMLIEAVTDVARDLLIKVRPPDSRELAAMRRRILQALRARDEGEAVRLTAAHMGVLHDYVSKRGGAELLRKQSARTG